MQVSHQTPFESEDNSKFNIKYEFFKYLRYCMALHYGQELENEINDLKVEENEC